MNQARVAIVTGAGSGIGRATCQILAKDGWQLTLVGRHEESLRRTQALISDPSASLIVPADVSARAQCGAVVHRTLEKWGRIDALVNNAAIVEVAPIEKVDEQKLLHTFAINSFGPLHLIAACWPVFQQQRNGRIVNVSSMATVDPFPGLSMYAASKAALESLTRSAMNEGRQHGILAFSIVLGAVETEMLRKVVSERDLAPEKALTPAEAAAVIAACVRGERDAEAGKPIPVTR